MVVDNFAQNEIINRIPNSQKVPVKGAFHEILNESDEMLEFVVAEILSFLK
jgi:alpha-beta hydrolase superfamily lysophospholipase